MLRLGALLILAFLALPQTAAGDEEILALAKPIAAFAFRTPTGVEVSWEPGMIAADGYRVYGLNGGQAHLLSLTGADARVADVPATYAAYTVAALLEGEESLPTPAAKVGTDCVFINLSPPGVLIGDCGLKAHPAVKLHVPP